MRTASATPAAAVAGVGRMEFGERLPDHRDAAGMLAEFYQEQVGRYGFAESVMLVPGEYTAPNGVFVVVYREGRPGGCGGYRWYDRASGTVEIKKTYIVPAWRGLGAGRALFEWLEAHAVSAGAGRAILETGVRNTAALALFTSSGYRPVARYVEGRDPAINRAFARQLTARAR